MGDQQRGPRIVQRRGGGWLAISGDDQPLKIGVTAESEQAAREKYSTAVSEWQRTLASDLPRGG